MKFIPFFKFEFREEDFYKKIPQKTQSIGFRFSELSLTALTGFQFRQDATLYIKIFDWKKLSPLAENFFNIFLFLFGSWQLKQFLKEESKYKSWHIWCGVSSKEKG